MERPQDVYTEVMDVVIRKVEHDSKHSDDDEVREYASLWLGKIDRNIVKRPVMTLPYGVKLYGIKDQIVNELRKRDIDYLGSDDPYKPSMYLAKVLWESIGEVVIASRQAMDWLQEVASVVSSTESAISWVTPAGFLVHQRCNMTVAKSIRTFWGEARVRVQLAMNHEDTKIDKMRQRNGISPNFVHSMDASHLMLTINRLKGGGINSFSSVHDSYGTHACDMDHLNRTLREAFVEQYSKDVLEDFKDQLLSQTTKSIELPAMPQKGQLELGTVIDSPYFFA